MTSNPQLNKHGELTHLLSIEGLPKKTLLHILDTAQSFVSIGEREVRPGLRVAISSRIKRSPSAPIQPCARQRLTSSVTVLRCPTWRQVSFDRLKREQAKNVSQKFRSVLN